MKPWVKDRREHEERTECRREATTVKRSDIMPSVSRFAARRGSLRRTRASSRSSWGQSLVSVVLVLGACAREAETNGSC